MSLSLDIIQDFGQSPLDGEPPVDWVEGATILVAILIFVLVGSLDDRKKERQFKLLNEKRGRVVKVIRDGEEQMTHTHNIVMGDTVLFEPGSLIPCDGIFAIDSSNLNAIRTPQLVKPFNVSISVQSTAFEDVDPDIDTVVSVGSKTETALSKFARNLGWASFKDARNGTNLISFSSDLQAILYSRSLGEVILPRCMRNVVVFYGPRLGRPIRREHHETASHDHLPTLQRAPQGKLLASPNVVRQMSTRGRTASETTARDVDREIRIQTIVPSTSTAETCPRDLSNGSFSTQLQSYAADDSTVLCPNCDGNGAIGSRRHIAIGSEWSTAQHGLRNCRAPVAVAVACSVSVSFLFFSYFYFHF